MRKVTPSSGAGHGDRAYEASRARYERYLRTVTFSTVEPAPWRPESPAQRATNSAGPRTLKRRGEAAAVGARGHDLLASSASSARAGGDDDRLAALRALERALDGDPARAPGDALGVAW